MTFARHSSNRHVKTITVKGKRTSTRSAQALISCYCSVQVKNPTIRSILHRCAQRRLKRIGQEGRKSAKLIKLESQHILPIIVEAEVSEHTPKTSEPSGKASAVGGKGGKRNRGASRGDQVPMNAKARKEFNKVANKRMQEPRKKRAARN